MRVTGNMLAGTATGQLNRNYGRMLELQRNIATGKRINAPSDDPVGAGRVLRVRETLAAIDQFGKNIQLGGGWLRASDNALSEADTLLIRAKELAVYQASETASDHTRQIAAGEVEGIFEQMLALANTRWNGSYLFAGHKTDAAPFAADAGLDATYAGNEGEIRVLISEKLEMTVNLDGRAVFAGEENLFDILKALKEGLENNDTEAISNQIERIDGAMDQLLGARATVGSRLNRLEATENHLQGFKLNAQELLSDTEDADLVAALTDLKAMESAYQAALMASADAIQPTLMAFLR